MSWEKYAYTSAGAAMLSESISGGALTITRAVSGTGTIDTDLSEETAVSAIARKPQGLKGENAEMYGRKLAEFGELCRGEREERKTDNGCLRRGGLCRGRRNCRSRMLQPSRNTADSCCKGGIFVI